MVNESNKCDFCCSLFASNVKSPNERGLCIVPCRSSKHGDFFFLEFHAVAPEDEGNLDTAIAVCTGEQHAIQFCPWCGVNLKKFYRKTFDTLPYVHWEQRPHPWGEFSQADNSAEQPSQNEKD